MNDRAAIRLSVNETQVACEVEPRRLLCDFIREDLGLTGTHVGCEHGVCGACTIMLDGQAVRSCLMFAVQAAGRRIETIEGLAQSGEIKRLQALFAENHALQCGFCTPAMLVVACDLLRSRRPLSREEVVEGMSAALCRCTGYRGIVEAVVQASGELKVEAQEVAKPAGSAVSESV